MCTVLFTHAPPAGRRALIWCLAWYLSVLIAPAAMAQDRGLAMEYTVKVARTIAEVEGNEALRYISAAGSSTSTWIGYDNRPFSISYYAQPA